MRRTFALAARIVSFPYLSASVEGTKGTFYLSRLLELEK
jgi:hypothetical protein